jgi:hypothetical protein
VLGTIGASFVFKSQIPIPVFPAPHDDGLFLRLADWLRSGDWLGPYDTLTLAKGPMYPMFVAAVEWLQFPLKISEHAIYLVAAGVMAWVGFRLTRSAAVALFLFGALSLNPLMWTVELARTIRDGLYVGLSLGVVASGAWLFLVPSGDATVRPRTALAVLTGVAIGVYWLTREEGIWLAPALGVLVLGAALPLRVRRAAPGEQTDPSRWTRALASLGWRLIIIAVSAGIVVGGVAAMNWGRYGVFLANDLAGGALPAAYGALTRINHDATDRYVPVPASARADAYRVSPAAAELQPFLDGQIGAQWTANSCGGKPAASGCNDIRAGWFVWALRDAVSFAGHWTSAQEAQEFLGRLAREVNTACDAGVLACGGYRDSLAPPIGLGTALEATSRFPAGLAVMMAAKANIRMVKSEGATLDLMRVALRVGRIAPPRAEPPRQLRLLGWVAATDGVPSVSVVEPSRGRGNVELTWSPAPDVDAFFQSRGEEQFRGRRFELAGDCSDPACSLRIRVGNGDERVLRLVDLTPGPVVQTPGLWLYVEQVEAELSATDELLDAATVEPHPRILAVMHSLRNVYAWVLPVGVTLGFAGVVLTILRRGHRMRFAATVALTVACAAAVSARLAVISILEVTSWPGAMANGYLAPGSPFLIAFAVFGCYLLLMSGRDLVRLIADRSPRL